jgi:D-amino-acid oxidase
MKIAVVGAGIFGCQIATELDADGHKVTLYDKSRTFLTGASYVNQYRLHRGYHYPRSKETVEQTRLSVDEFEEKYKNCISKQYDRYYAIAENSITTPDNYIKFLNDNSLPYEIIDPFINVPLMVKVNENSFNYYKLWNKIQTDFWFTDIKFKFRTQFNKRDIKKYDYVINCTYSDINKLLETDQQTDYQFELVEKIITKRPEKYKNSSLVIMDGNYGCIDPHGDDMSVIGHVSEAIHDSFIGKRYKMPNNIQTKHPQIIKACEDLFETKLQYITSKYVVRTVLSNHEHDDARPTQITKHTDKLISVFGGKIGTSTTTAKELIKYII